MEKTSWIQIQWDGVLDICGQDQFTVRVIGTFCISMLAYWSLGSLFTLVDYTGKPKFMLKYKVQENVKSYPISREQLKDLIQVLLLNQFLILPLATLSYYLDDKNGTQYDRNLPDFFTCIYHLITFALIREVFFYYSHRLLHHPLLYKRIHKKHHNWTSPIAISAAYCHPVEHVVSNILPIALGPSLMKSHTILLWLWTIIASFQTLTTHSGFHLPLFSSPEFHDFHHLKFNYNYGALGILDYFHGTDSLFRKSKQFKRHRRTWTTTPIKILFP